MKSSKDFHGLSVLNNELERSFEATKRLLQNKTKPFRIFLTTQGLESRFNRQSHVCSIHINCVAFFKQYILLGIVLLCCCHRSNSQDSLIFKRAMFKATARTMTGELHSGYLWAINDTAAQIRQAAIYPRSELILAEPYLKYSDIESLELRRRHSTARGILFGALLGTIVGGIVGAVSADDGPDCNPATDPFCLDFGPSLDAIGYGSTGLLIGGTVGGLIGAFVKTTVPIKGQKEKMRLALKRVTRSGTRQ